MVRNHSSLSITREEALGSVACICIALLVLEPLFYFGGYINAPFTISFVCFVFSVVIKRSIRLNVYISGYGLFAFYAAMSMFWSPSLGVGIIRLRDVCMYLMIIIVITQYGLFTNDRESVYKRCDKLMSYYILLMLMLTLYSYCIEGSSLLTWARLGKTVYEKHGMNQIYYSCFMLVSFYFIIIKLFQSDGKKRYIYIFLALFQYFSFVLMGIRKVLVLPIIFIYIFLLWKNRKHAVKIIGITIGIAILSSIAVCLVMKYSSSAAGRITQLIALLKGESSQEGSYIERNLLVKLAMKCFLQNPIFGKGLGQFRWFSVQNGGPDLYAHNNYMEMLSCLGLVGFVLYYKNLLYIFIKELKKKSNISCFIVATVITSFFADLYQISYYYECFAILFGIVACLVSRKQLEIS